MDVASGEYGNVLARLVSGIENGRLIYHENPTPTSESPSSSRGNTRTFLIHFFFLNKEFVSISFCLVTDNGFDDEDEDVNMLDGHSKKTDKTKDERLFYAAPFHTQVAVLLGRTWRTIWREKVLTFFFMYFVQHLKSTCHSHFHVNLCQPLLLDS